MPSGRATEAGHAPWRLVLAVACLAGIALLTVHCHRPPAVVGAKAPNSVFSAERAALRLQDLLGAEDPHPLGSTANAEVRTRLLAQLDALGLAPRTSDHWVPAVGTWSTGLVRTRNVLAELPCSNPELPALLLACHYDSVPAGPGAGDDGAAMAAILEVARILQAEAPLPRPVILLFTDGEELGLYGARAFALFDPTADRVGMVLNFEARGTSGGSLMFETSPHNRWMVGQVAESLARPMTSSAYVDVYRRMPNGSDLTVFIHRKLAGLNFAFIGDPKHYHTPLDNLANLDPRSLQHHGDNALALTRQLLRADWSEAAAVSGDAVFTDLFARVVIAWPASWGPWLAGLLLLVGYPAFHRARKERGTTGRSLLRVTAALLLVIVLAPVFAWLAGILLTRSVAPAVPWPAGMTLHVLTQALFAVVGMIVGIRLTRPDPRLFFIVLSLTLALGALVLALQSPGFSYLLLLPALPATLSSTLFLARRITPNSLLVATLAIGACTTVLGVPFLLRLPEALGVRQVPPVIGILMATIVLPVVPLLGTLPKRLLTRTGLALTIASAAAFLATIAAPVFTADAPRHLTFTYLEVEGDPRAQLAVSSWEAPVPASLLTDAVLREDPYPLFEVPGILVESAPSGALAPTVALVQQNTTDDTHRVRLHVRPTQASQRIFLGIPLSHALAEVTVHGKALTLPPEEKQDRKWLRFLGVPAEGIEIEVAWKGPPDLPLVTVGITTGLPPHLQELAARRAKLPAVPSHQGDETIAVKEVLLERP